MFFPIEENERGTAILSSHDLKCISFLDKLYDAGVRSFKIEGRMKTAYYVATVVNAYRQMIDGNYDLDVLDKELECISHRPYSSGFYFGDIKKNHNNDGDYIQGCKFVGVVLEKNEDMISVEVRNRIRVGDKIEVVSPGNIGQSFEVNDIIDKYGNHKEIANFPKEIICIPCALELKSGDLLRISVN